MEYERATMGCGHWSCRSMMDGTRTQATIPVGASYSESLKCDCCGFWLVRATVADGVRKFYKRKEAAYEARYGALVR